jgi:murein DD-endopeptidase MepM/ murein hydrolase activator NlpD
MQIPHPHPIRGHGRASAIVVLVLLAGLVSLTWPAGASGAPVAPVPVGVWPLQPRPAVVRAFDPPDLPFGAGHRGVDLAGAPGQPVGSALFGRVTFAGTLAGRGVVVVDHGATRTTYQPVDASVHVGQLVLPGQRLGTLQLLGSHCFPRACLHWGWIRGDTYLDPLILVGAGPIRLLPLWLPTPLSGLLWRPPAQPFVGPVARLLRLRPGPRSPSLLRRPVPRVPRPWAMRPLLL